jgi:hypothetical protein
LRRKRIEPIKGNSSAKLTPRNCYMTVLAGRRQSDKVYTHTAYLSLHARILGNDGTSARLILGTIIQTLYSFI